MSFDKNFKSTKSLYGVTPDYFAGKEYYEVLKEKIKLGKNMIKKINSEIDYRMPEDEYKAKMRQLNEAQKAVNFNENLLTEYQLFANKK